MSEAAEDLSTEVEEAPEQTMDDTIRETLEAINARNDEPEATEEVAEDKSRDDKGRFASKEAPAEEAPVEQPEEPEAHVVPPELQKLGLRKDEAEAFSKADKAVQDAFIRRSDEMHRGFEQVRNKAQFGSEVEQAIGPLLPVLQQNNIAPVEAVRRLFGAEMQLRNGSPAQKVAMLNKLATDYGIDLGQVNEYAANQPMVDPRVQALEQQLQQQQSWIQQQNQATEWRERQTLNSEITRFASSPEHGFFEEVRGDMAGLLQAGLAPDLATAYDMAIYANPAVRARVLAQQQVKAQESGRTAASQKASSAKAAAAVNVSRKGTLPAAKAVGTMDDTIRETAQRLGLIS